MCGWGGGGGASSKTNNMQKNAKEENYLARRNIGIVSVFRKQS